MIRYVYSGTISPEVDQHSRSGVRGCYYAQSHLDLLTSPASRQGWIAPGRESHTTAPAVCHTVQSCRRTSWVRNPKASHRAVFNLTRMRMTTLSKPCPKAQFSVKLVFPKTASVMSTQEGVLKVLIPVCSLLALVKVSIVN